MDVREFELIYGKYASKRVEYFGAIALNLHFDPLTSYIVSIGSEDQAFITPAMAFSTAIKRLASNIIFFHNHPNHDLTPSIEDMNMCAKLIMTGQILRVEVVDFIIIGKNRKEVDIFSFAENGLLTYDDDDIKALLGE